MANMTVKKLLDGIAIILQDTEEDEDDRTWTYSDLVDAYNTERRGIIAKYPDANVLTQSVKLLAGVEQYIPSSGIALLTVPMNMGTDGETPGTPVVKCELAEIQRSDRSWQSATAQEEIYNFMPDPADPRHFWNYPPSDGTGYISEEYSDASDDIIWDEDGGWETAIVAVSEKYIQMLEKRIIARAYKRDTDIPGNIVRENDNQQEASQGG